MSFRSDRFNRSMRSFEKLAENYKDASKIATLSDRGASVARMIEQIEPTPDEHPDPHQELAGAVLRLIIAEKEHLVPTLLLIAQNGDNRETSIRQLALFNKTAWEAAKRRYYRQRNQLVEFFMSL